MQASLSVILSFCRLTRRGRRNNSVLILSRVHLEQRTVTSLPSVMNAVPCARGSDNHTYSTLLLCPMCSVTSSLQITGTSSGSTELCPHGPGPWLMPSSVTHTQDGGLGNQGAELNFLHTWEVCPAFHGGHETLSPQEVRVRETCCLFLPPHALS